MISDCRYLPSTPYPFNRGRKPAYSLTVTLRSSIATYAGVFKPYDFFPMLIIVIRVLCLILVVQLLRVEPLLHVVKGGVVAAATN